MDDNETKDVLDTNEASNNKMSETEEALKAGTWEPLEPHTKNN